MDLRERDSRAGDDPLPVVPAALDPAPRPARSELWWLAALTALGAVLRFSTLGVQSFWLDEGATRRLTSEPFHSMLAGVRLGETSPQLYYILAWAWVRVFGSGEVGLRSLSAVFGTLMIPVVFDAGRTLGGRRVAIVAAALTTTSPYLLWYSQEARSYALFALLASASLALFLRALDRPRWIELAGWAAVSSLAVWAHYFALVLVVAEAAVLLVKTNRRLAVAIASLATGIAVVPPCRLALVQQSTDKTAWIGQIPLGRRIWQTFRTWALGGHDSAVSSLRTALTLLALALLAAAVTLLVTRAGRLARRRVVPVAVVAATALLVPLAGALAGKDVFFHRNLIGAWAPLALIAAMGLGAEGARRTGVALTAAACAFGIACSALVLADPSLQREDWRGLARALETRAPRAVVARPGNDTMLRLYAPRLRAFPQRAAISEIDVVYSPDLRPRIPAGFVEVPTLEVPWLALVRYRSPRPVLVSLAGLERGLSPGSVVLLDR